MKITNLCPKCGKTTLSYKLFGEKALLLGFEQGYSLIRGIHALPINSYSELNKVLKQLKDDKVKAKYDVIVFDTVDLFHNLMERYLCSINGVSSINEIGSMGMGYAKLDTLINDVLLKIIGMGYKLFFISHANVKKAIINTPNGEVEVEKYFPSVAKRTYQIVSKLCDNIWYISMEIDSEGKVIRKLYTRDNKLSFGGTRMEHLPNTLPLDVNIINEELTKALEKAGASEDVKSFIPNYDVKELDFNSIKNELVDLVQTKFAPNNRMDVVKDTTEKFLGLNATIMNATPNQVEALSIILEELKSI